VGLVSRVVPVLVLVVLSCALAVAAVGSASSRARGDARFEAEAQRVVTVFFRTINQRRYERTCALLADGFFEGMPTGRERCALGFRIGFTGLGEFRVRFLGVRVEGDRAVVGTVVDGAPGRIVIVREAGRYRVLRVEG
jgi:hypothetical protein